MEENLEGVKLPNLGAYCWLHIFLLMQHCFRIGHYFPYTLEKLQNCLFIAWDCGETVPAHQLCGQWASCDLWGVCSQRLAGPAKTILLSFAHISKVNFCIFFFHLYFFYNKVSVQQLHVTKLERNGVSAPVLALLCSRWNDRLQGPGSLCLSV